MNEEITSGEHCTTTESQTLTMCASVVLLDMPIRCKIMTFLKRIRDTYTAAKSKPSQCASALSSCTCQ